MLRRGDLRLTKIVAKCIPAQGRLWMAAAVEVVHGDGHLIQRGAQDMLWRIDGFHHAEVRHIRDKTAASQVNATTDSIITAQLPENIPSFLFIVATDDNPVRGSEQFVIRHPGRGMKENGIPVIRFFLNRKKDTQVCMYAQKAVRVSENMVGDMMLRGYDIGENRVFEQCLPIVPKANHDNPVLPAKQGLLAPVFPCTAFIRVEKMNISGEHLLSADGSGIHLHRKPRNTGSLCVDADIVFLHKKDAASVSGIALEFSDAIRRDIDKQTGIVRRFRHLIFVQTINNHGSRFTPQNLPGQSD